MDGIVLYFLPSFVQRLKYFGEKWEAHISIVLENKRKGYAMLLILSPYLGTKKFGLV